MKNIFAIVFVVLFAAGFACQVKPLADKEYSTTVSGQLLMSTRPVPNAVIKAGGFDATSDTNGNYSVTVSHDGSFDLYINGYSGKFLYTEKVSTEVTSLIRNVSKP